MCLIVTLLFNFEQSLIDIHALSQLVSSLARSLALW